ncbi:MAG: MlaD family protein [Acidobacteria bacterium]|nr:MlaD family protein [Acidobacteriota bacterium]
MESKNKVLVGLFVGGCLVLFGVGLFLIGSANQLFTKSFHVYADFAKITGIQNGSKVRVAGMDAGTVIRIDVPPRPETKFRVHFRLAEKLHPIVRADSMASIQTDGLLGNKYLQVAAGTSDAPVAAADSMIPSTEPFDWGDLMDEISSAVKQVNGVLTAVKEQLSSTLTEVENVVRSVNVVVKDATPAVKGIVESAHKITGSLNEIIDGVQAGEGTMGALFKDKELYASVRRSAEKTEQTIENVREATASVKKITAKVDESDIVPEVQRTVANLQRITLQVKDAVDKFQSASGEGGVGENLQRTLADAHEAMSDLADNTEALKHNFFFRGFFKRRGFYDLGSITTREYLSKGFAKGFKQHRIWLESAELFSLDSKGIQVLSPAGKRRLDEVIAEVMTLPRNGPLIVEGFAGEGTDAQRYLVSRRRSSRVQTYIIDRFRLRPTYVGIVARGAEPVAPGSAVNKEGIAIVSYYKE